jgi:hypothetical protein
VTAGRATGAPFAYPPTMPSHRFRLTVVVALLVSTGLASAQIDDRARELLEGLHGGDHDVVRTLDQTMVATVQAQGMERTVRTRTQVDFEGRRAAIDTEVAPGMSARIVIVDGEARMTMGGVSMALPPGMGDAYEGMFEREPALLAEGVTATYDGYQSYGDLLAGEQVTLHNAAGLPGMEGAAAQRLVFDDDGRLLGFVTEVPETGVMIGVLDAPQTGNPFVGKDATIHLLLPDGTTQPFMRLVFEDIRVNEPIDPAAFD